MTQIPRAFFARELARQGIAYPVDDLAVGELLLSGEAPRATVVLFALPRPEPRRI